MRLYLSPSNQPSNKYVVGNTTEKIEMETIAAKVKVLLDKGYNCETVVATLSLGIGSSERPQECKNKSCDFYLAIHSNAAGGTPPCTAAGAVGFYHPSSAKSKELMTAMVNELNAICPVKSNRASQVASGMTQFNGQGYGEIRSPMQKGVPSALVEVNFHDNIATAQWIISSKDAIAAAIVKVIVAIFGISKKTGSAPVEPEKPAPGVLYRVQTGAFGCKDYAERLAAELKAKGFDTYLTQAGGYYKVQVGAYAQKGNADAMAAKLKAAGYDTYITTNGGAPAAPSAPAITVGCKVRVNAGAKTYTGGGLASFVYRTVYDVIQVDGARVVIGIGKAVTAAMNVADLKKV